MILLFCVLDDDNTSRVALTPRWNADVANFDWYIANYVPSESSIY